MTRLRLLLLVSALSLSCSSTRDIVDSAQGVLEYHQARYLRLCHNGDDASAACVQYGMAINILVDTLDDVDNGSDTSLTGRLPKNAKEALDDAKKAVGDTSVRVKESWQ